MIDSVRIRGFQSLADVELKLGRFTVIQGRSNSGKSAVVRALRAATTNGANMRGTGGSFIRKGSKESIVELRRDGRTLTWTKSTSKTVYDVDGREFKTGTEVPDEVLDFLRLGDIELDKENKLNVNFQGGGRGQGQFEPPFLVVDRPGSYLAKVFSLLTSANVLYAAQAVAKKDANASKGKLKTIRELCEADQARLATLRTEHETLKAASEQANAFWTAVSALDAERTRLVALRDAYATTCEQVAACDSQLAQMAVLDDSGVEQAQATLAAATSLRQYATALAQLDAEMATLAEVPALPEGFVEQAEASVNQLIQGIASLRSIAAALQEADAGIATADAQMAAELDAEQAAELELAALLDELQTCPTCNQSLLNAPVLA